VAKKMAAADIVFTIVLSRTICEKTDRKIIGKSTVKLWVTNSNYATSHRDFVNNKAKIE
jgi:hypothetical protein